MLVATQPLRQLPLLKTVTSAALLLASSRLTSGETHSNSESFPSGISAVRLLSDECWYTGKKSCSHVTKQIVLVPRLSHLWPFLHCGGTKNACQLATVCGLALSLVFTDLSGSDIMKSPHHCTTHGFHITHVWCQCSPIVDSEPVDQFNCQTFLAFEASFVFPLMLL